MTSEDYERGYRDGENSARFDMEFALTEYGDYSHYRAAIEALAEEAASEPGELDMYDPGVFNAGTFMADWLRSHLKARE